MCYVSGYSLFAKGTFYLLFTWYNVFLHLWMLLCDIIILPRSIWQRPHGLLYCSVVCSIKLFCSCKYNKKINRARLIKLLSLFCPWYKFPVLWSNNIQKCLDLVGHAIPWQSVNYTLRYTLPPIQLQSL